MDKKSKIPTLLGIKHENILCKEVTQSPCCNGRLNLNIIRRELKKIIVVYSHKGSEVYTAEPDIPEPSLIEVDLAIEKLKRHKATGVDHIPSELIQAGGGNYTKKYINSLYSFGTRKNCHKNGKNPLLFQFIRKAIEWTVIIIEKFHSCLLQIKFFRTYFYQE